MRTPRPATPTRRGIKTLPGHGWLSESPRNVWPHGWDIRGRSLLRKCLFLPIPQEVQALGASIPISAAMPPPPQRPEPPPVVHRRDPRKDARILPVVSHEEAVAAQKRALFAAERAKALGKPLPQANIPHHAHAPFFGPQLAAPAACWYEDPVALGTLLIVVPPIGLAALWASKRYSTDARWALTVMTALTMFLATAVIVALVLR